MSGRGRRTVRIGYGRMRIVASAYAVLPLTLFMIGFVRWYFALAGVCAIALAMRMIVRQRRESEQPERALEVPVSALALVFAVMLLWTQLGGMNGYLFQTSDWNERNAVFRDLITHRWPVMYETGDSALVYYVGHWLPAALVGKLAGAVFGSQRFAWFFGRMALWAWSSLGLTILAVLLFLYTGADTFAKRALAVAVLVLFSGMDIVGTLYYHKQDWLLGSDVLHLEWWQTFGYQYTSTTACVYWVFNQSIVPWIVTMLFLLDGDERNYVLYGAACMICGALPAVGLAILMLGRALARLARCVRRGCARDWLKAVFSPGNLLALALCVPTVALYLLSNGALARTGDSGYVLEQPSFFSAGYWNRSLLLFYALEVGVYLALMWNEHRRDPLYYVVAVSLACIPYFHVGTSTDFCMRASIPGVFVTLAFAARYLTRWLFPKKGRRKRSGDRWRRLCAAALLAAMACGAVTPCVEIYRGLYNVFTRGSVELASDTLVTFEDNVETSYNFVLSDADQCLFYRALARQP